ncbi:alkaline phosphatase PafA [Puia dinghuensis]|uniref:Alkaline phosphatase family protein n=1 Tax=Puia dinghuensis TaxID=1792502 RepID=A0A8J2UI59_9BACT|nr:alkaline phosphatase PafA [Puia dinghuensis]GGB21501.1 alkaline phosphatase family protein [Puia dinghuensis]
MNRKPLLTLTFFLLAFAACNPKKTADVKRPKLVVGIVVDQMRWDYLYRYSAHYGEGGLKRLLKEGFSCDNTMINYLPAFTAVGHACIFTGSVPAFTGIAANDWVEQSTGQRMYCTDDSTVKSIGAEDPESKEGKMSPRNMLVSTVTDELMLASNFRSKVVGVSIKDRAAILPAGHSATAAFWLDDSTGHFITSNYYMTQLPSWVDGFNKQEPVKAYVKNKWTTLYPKSTYGESDTDDQPYEGKFKGDSTTAFPHNLDSSYKIAKSSFRYTPFGNTLTLDFAKAAVEGYQLGQGDVTDFLTINCASTDYVGHQFGINSIEEEDTYLRFDRDLAAFLTFLDEKLGKDGYTLFLTADHGAAHAVWFSQNHDIPADYFLPAQLTDSLNAILGHDFQTPNLVDTISNYQVTFAMKTIRAKKLDFSAIKKVAVDWLRRQPGITYAIDMSNIGEGPVAEPVRSMVINGYYYKRSGAIQLIPNAGWFEGRGKTGTSHGTWNPYDTHIPLIFMGWGIHSGHTEDPVKMTDIAPTVAALLHIQMPNGCVGKPITQVLKK